MKKFIIVAILSISTLSSISAQVPYNREEQYYGLRKLKQASQPRYVRMVKITNMISSKQVISEGILFTYKNRSAKNVLIAGNFSAWQVQQMERGDNGVWFYLLDNYEEKENIRYKYCIDGTWMFDQNSVERIDDQAGSFLSIVEPYPKQEGRQVSFRYLRNSRIEFRMYRPQARSISLVGDFNHWNPENDLLRKGRDGIWRLTKKIHPGNYRYRYLIDGIPSPDTYNPHSASDDTGDLCSLITVQ